MGLPFEMGEESAALDLLKRATGAVQRAEAKMAALETTVISLAKTVEENDRLLHGNGADDGLKGRLGHAERTARENKKLLTSISKKVEGASVQREGFRWSFWKDVLVAFISAAAGALAVILSNGGA